MQAKSLQETTTNSLRQVARRAAVEAISNSPRQVAQRAAVPQPNRTELPDKLKAGVESLSGHSLDDVRVHYNSDMPAQLQAHAYGQGSDIHVAPGQKKHLPHETWHVAQQKQGRVRPTMQLKGMGVNDDSSLEKEATVMRERAAQTHPQARFATLRQLPSALGVVQRAVGFAFETGWHIRFGDSNKPESMERLQKKCAVGTTPFTDFKIEADEAEVGKSEIEFIVDSFVEEGPRGESTLDDIMPDMEQLGLVLEAQTSRSGPLTWDAVTGNAVDAGLTHQTWPSDFAAARAVLRPVVAGRLSPCRCWHELERQYRIFEA